MIMTPASEQFWWFRRHGFTAREITAAVGLEMRDPVTLDDAWMALEMTWEDLTGQAPPTFGDCVTWLRQAGTTVAEHNGGYRLNGGRGEVDAAMLVNFCNARRQELGEPPFLVPASAIRRAAGP